MLLARDLSSAQEWELARPEAGLRMTGLPAWSPTSQSVAVTTVFADPATGDWRGGAGIVIADAVNRPPTPHPRPVMIIPGDHTLVWTSPAWAGEDLLVVELCCDVVDGTNDVEESRVLAVDPSTGERGRTILSAAAPISWIEVDAAGSERCSSRAISCWCWTSRPEKRARCGRGS